MLAHIIPFALFVVVMTGTPGPGNLTMLAIGQSFGFRAALPFLFGAMWGFVAMNLLVGFGLGQLLTASQTLSLSLRVLGMGYIVYLGVKIVRNQLSAPGDARYFTMLEGLLVHPLSPKSWAMSVAAFTQFADPAAALAPQALLFAGMFTCGLLTFHSLWCLAGAAILKVLQGRATLAVVNGLVVLAMVSATAWAMVM